MKKEIANIEKKYNLCSDDRKKLMEYIKKIDEYIENNIEKIEKIDDYTEENKTESIDNNITIVKSKQLKDVYKKINEINEINEINTNNN